MTRKEKLTILVEEPLTYMELMLGAPRAPRKMREVQVDPITLPHGLWEQAEARHAGQAPMKKVRSQEDFRMLRSILWGRYGEHQAIRRNWYRRNEMEGVTARFIPLNEDEAWTPQESAFVIYGDLQ